MAASETVRKMVLRIPVGELVTHLENLEDELSRGKSIELVRGQTVIAEVTAPKALSPSATSQERVIPDFMGRMKEIWGDQVFPEGYMAQVIREAATLVASSARMTAGWPPLLKLQVYI